jgi:hypothetical protein
MMADPEVPTGIASPRRGRFQLGLRVVFWLVAVIAVWMTFFINRLENTRLTAKIESLRPLARDLSVDDQSQIAVVKLHELWQDHQRWDVYLPPGRYRVCMSTRKVADDGLARPSKSSPIGPGRHRLGLEVDTVGSDTRIHLTLEGVRLFTVEEASHWGGTGWSSDGEISRSEQRPADQPLVLVRRRNSYTAPNTPMYMVAGPTNGILLWIERTAEADHPPPK